LSELFLQFLIVQDLLLIVSTQYLILTYLNIELVSLHNQPHRWCHIRVVDCWFERRSSQTKDFKKLVFVASPLGTAKHAALRSSSKDWLALNQDNVSEWGDMSTTGLLFQ